MDFKNWLAEDEVSEAITSSGDCASFSRIAIGGPQRRGHMPLITFEPESKPRKGRKGKKKDEAIEPQAEPKGEIKITRIPANV